MVTSLNNDEGRLFHPLADRSTTKKAHSRNITRMRFNSRRARRAVYAGLGVDAERLPTTIWRHVVQSVRDGLVMGIGERNTATAAPLGVDLPAVVIGVDLADDGDGAIVVWITCLRT